MSWVAVAIGGSVISGAMQAGAASDASDAQRRSAEEAQYANDKRYKEILGLTEDYRNTGTAANKRLQMLLGLGGVPGGGGKSGETFSQAAARLVAPVDEQYAGVDPNDPNFVKERQRVYAQARQETSGGGIDSGDAEYGSLTKPFTEADLAKDVPYNKGLEFGMNEGREAINSRAVQNGGYDSGATLKALTRFATDYGSTKAGEAYNRDTAYKSNIYAMLTGQQGVGINAVNSASGAGQNNVNANTGLITDAGNARAAGIVGGANGAASAFGGVSNAIQGYQNNQILSKILSGNRYQMPAAP